MANEKFADRISYKENDEGDIEISEILAILHMFNIDDYPIQKIDSYPVASYGSKKKCVDNFIKYVRQEEAGDITDKDNPYNKMAPIVSDIFRLYDHLEKNIESYYRAKNANGRYGAVGFVTTATDNKYFESRFGAEKIKYSTAKGILYPLVGAFRALVKVNEDGSYGWKKDPFATMDEVGPELVNGICEQSKGTKPTVVGKQGATWQNLFMRVLYTTMF